MVSERVRSVDSFLATDVLERANERLRSALLRHRRGGIDEAAARVDRLLDRIG
jgi:uncharacterized membrane protein YccC